LSIYLQGTDEAHWTKGAGHHPEISHEGEVFFSRMFCQISIKTHAYISQAYSEKRQAGESPIAAPSYQHVVAMKLLLVSKTLEEFLVFDTTCT